MLSSNVYWLKWYHRHATFHGVYDMRQVTKFPQVEMYLNVPSNISRSVHVFIVT